VAGNKKQKEFEIPEQLLNQLNECSPGGFILFSFHSNGNQQVHTKFDSPAHAAALRLYVNDWITALNNISIGVTESIILNRSKKK
jgi:hypothetical protein